MLNINRFLSVESVLTIFNSVQRFVAEVRWKTYSSESFVSIRVIEKNVKLLCKAANQFVLDKRSVLHVQGKMSSSQSMEVLLNISMFKILVRSLDPWQELLGCNTHKADPSQQIFTATNQVSTIDMLDVPLILYRERDYWIRASFAAKFLSVNMLSLEIKNEKFFGAFVIEMFKI